MATPQQLWERSKKKPAPEPAAPRIQAAQAGASPASTLWNRLKGQPAAALHHVEAFGKGALRSGGYNRALDPNESRAVAAMGELTGNLLQFGKGFKYAGKIIPISRRAPIVTMAARSGLASAGMAGLKEVVGEATGSGEPGIDTGRIVREGALGAAIPAGFSALGGAAHAGLKGIGAVARAAGAPQLDPMRIHVGTFLGKLLIPSDKLRTAISYRIQTPERYFQLHGLAARFGVSRLLDVLARFDGPRSRQGAGMIGVMLRREAQKIAQAVGTGQAPGYAAEAMRELKSAGELLFRSSRLNRPISNAVLDRVASKITKAISNSYFNRSPHKVEKDFWIFVKETLINSKTTGERKAENFVRGMISHLFIGAFNPASAFTNLTALATNIAAKEGTSATSWALQQVGRNSRLTQAVFQRVVGQGFGQRAHVASGALGVELGKVGQASMSLFLGGERYLRTVAGLARYYNLTRRGIPSLAALEQASKAARQQLFDYTYNLPQILRMPGLGGNIIRTMLQFYPFVLNQANFVASLNLGEFARFMTSMFAVGGVAALPMVRLADRIPAIFAAGSILDRLRADPQWQPYIEGPLAMGSAAIPGLNKYVDVPGLGASMSQRTDFSYDLATRLFNLNDAPWRSWLSGFTEAFSTALADPTDENIKRLVVAAGPLSGQNVEKALQAEKTGMFTSTTGLPVAEVESDKSLGLRGLGFTPVEQSSGHGLRGVQLGLEAQGRRQTEGPRRMLRQAVQSGNDALLEQAVNRLVDLGSGRDDIYRLVKEAALTPEERAVRETPERLRAKLDALIDKREKAKATRKKRP